MIQKDRVLRKKWLKAKLAEAHKNFSNPIIERASPVIIMKKLHQGFEAASWEPQV